METRERLLAKVAAILGLVIVCLSPVRTAAEIPCVCRYAGQYYALGECVCINRSGGTERACCDKVLNNTSWSFSGDGCPIAMTEPAAPAGMRAFSGVDFDVAPKIAFTRHSAFMPH